MIDNSLIPRGAVFLSGPMTGIPEHNVPAFERATERARNTGFHIISPVELFRNTFGEHWLTQPRKAYLYAAYAVLMDPHTEGIMVLPGWEYSEGSYAEVVMAASLQLRFFRAEDGYEFPPYKFSKMHFEWR